jgi:hypothetical protein
MSDDPLIMVLGELRNLNAKIDAQGEQLRAQGDDIRAQGEQLRALTHVVHAQGEQLRTQGEQLRAQGEQLRAQAELLHALDEKSHAQSEQLLRMRVDLSARMDRLSDGQNALRQDQETTFYVADRAIRINKEATNSIEGQLASMVRQLRALDGRVRAIEGDKAA